MAWTKHVDAADARLIWAFGKPYQFHWVTIVNTPGMAVVPLDPTNYNGGAARVGQRFQKSQIVLHGTDSNNEAKSTLNGFINGPLQPPGWRAAAHIVVERTQRHTVPESAATGVPPRADRTRIARLHPDAVFDDTDDFIDVVRLVDLNASVIHGSSVNDNAIGIEHVNAQDGFWQFDPDKNIWYTLVKDETVDPATHRPRDRNRWIHITHAGSNDAVADMQAFEDEQYNSIILMLRAICIEQRIPRQFLGDTWDEKTSHFTKGVANAAELRERRSKVFRYRGLIQHWNTEVKLCPGSFAMNRMFRGIIDEWWLPVELSGFVRPYYSGPFWNPTFTAPDNGGQPTKPAWFRWLGWTPPMLAGAVSVESAVYHDVDLDALTETRSYFDLDEINNYYTHCETEEGGLFPVGQNRIWHGGVHLEPDNANTTVYAAASGTIVAARVSSNAVTDAQPGYGSQRFVLIRHAVYWQTEATPNAPPGTNQQRINYDTAPSYIFSLYMHLAPIPDLYSEHSENPRWYNKWLRQKALLANPATPDTIPAQAVLDQDIGLTAGGDKGKVFNPNVEVSVGDVLGVAGGFAGWLDPATQRKMIHFEVISHRDTEITLAGARNADDPDQNAVCDVNVINQELGAAAIDPANMMSIVAPRLRDLRVRHRSSWSWDKPDLLFPVTSVADANANWPHLSRMMWVQDALAANPSLTAQLGNSNFFWHYHPITFMAAINKLILGENREITQAPFQNVTANVEVDENYFLTSYFDFTGGAWNAVNADNKAVKPYEFEGTGFSITRAKLACKDSTVVPPPPHQPNAIPQGTLFSLALLEIYERVAVRYNEVIAVDCTSVCQGHTAEIARCCRNDLAYFQPHIAGTAIDFHPERAQNKIRNLWKELKTVRDGYNAQAQRHAGTSCHGNLPVGFGGVDFTAQSDVVTNKLNASPQEALTAPELAAFCVHLALTPV